MSKSRYKRETKRCLLFSIYCWFKIVKSNNSLNDNKEISTENQEAMINELKERIKNLENK